MTPIPRALLPHDVEVSAPDPDAAYEGAYLEPRTVRRVRFERAEALNPSAYKLADGAKGRIWMDARNSEGAFEVPVGSKVEVGGRTAKALSCTPCFAGAKVHHWEVDVGWE